MDQESRFHLVRR